MQQECQIQVKPEIAGNPSKLKLLVAKKYKLHFADVNHVEILKRSVDARKANVKINLKLKVFVKEDFVEKDIEIPKFKDVSEEKEIIIIGAGPAGLFAALKLIEKGLRPIILERGKDVQERRRDLAALTKNHVVNMDSNYCFGEGGAGTYSDGKLYTRSKKRGDVNKILELLMAHGASKNIAVDAHPHIGTNKLPRIIKAIRETILKYGGKVIFDARVVDILLKNSAVAGVKMQNGDIINADKVLLATGHSARDIFELLQSKKILIEAKSFALGVRVEHSQQLIDRIQYHCESRGEYLPPAPYSIVKQINGRGVYSFCMCPGGVIAPCATAPGEVVTNGWSPSKRDQATSNSGIVVELKLADFSRYSNKGALAGVEFQKQIEQSAWHLAGETQRVVEW